MYEETSSRDKERLILLASSKKAKSSDTSLILDKTFTHPSHPLNGICTALAELQTPWKPSETTFDFLTILVHNKKLEGVFNEKGPKDLGTEDSMPSLLEKYSYKKKDIKKEEETKDEMKSIEFKVIVLTPDDFEYRFSEIYQKIIKESTIAKDKTRLVFAFLDVDRYYRTRHIRMANSLATMLSEKEAEYTSPKNIEEFSQFLADLQIIHGLDYRCFVSITELAEYLAASCRAINKEQSKKNLANVDLSGKPSKTTQYSQYEGITNVYSKCWLAMLMAIPGISEQKATSVVKRFPSIKSFMDYYGKPDWTSKEATKDLASSQITYLKNDGTSKNLGPGNAAKILTALTSFDPNVKI